MLTLDGRDFLDILHGLLDFELRSRSQKGTLDHEALQNIASAARSIAKDLAALDLPVSVKTATEMLPACKTHANLNATIRQLYSTIALELDGRKFYGPLRPFEQYYDQPKLFGPTVFKNFPSAKDDIYEAGMCLALERGTACVMHLMRVLEVGLAALARTLDVPHKNDWGKYTEAIGDELDKRAETAKARSAEEQFYAEAGVNFDRLRRAYRNPTMHPDKSYSQERAKEILEAVKSFMSHLATKISEAPSP